MIGKVHQLSPNGPTVLFKGKVLQVPKVKFVVTGSKKESVACREQYPLKVAYAMAVHRAQGQTMKHLIIDCKKMNKPGQIGVSVGRAVCKRGLSVCNYECVFAERKHPDSVYNFYKEKGTEPSQDMTCCATAMPTDDTQRDGVSYAQPSCTNDEFILENPHVPLGDMVDVGQHSFSMENLLKYICPYTDTEANTEQQTKLFQHLDEIKTTFNLTIFVNWASQKVDILMEDTVPQSTSSKFSKSFGHIHQYLTSEDFIKHCCYLFCTPKINPTQNKIGERIFVNIIIGNPYAA